MKHIVDLSWRDKLTFEGKVDGHIIVVDADEETGGSNLGMRPKKMMLTALAGCTGIDVIMILRKMKVFIKEFSVIVEGDITEEHPKQYFKMKVIYQFKGENLPMKKLEKAVKLSEDKYCGVSAVYKKVMEVKTEIRIVD